MRVGYARVSTDDQDLEAQRFALKGAGVHAAAIFEDVISGRAEDRPQLARAVAALSPGDELVVLRLDRLTRRGPGSLFAVLEAVKRRGARVRSISEPWADPDSPAYELLVSVFGWVAAYEAQVLRARTREGIQAAKARGKHCGRAPALSPAQVQAMRDMLDAGRTVGDVVEVLGVSRSTVTRYRKASAPLGPSAPA